MAYDMDKYREKREKVLGVKGRGLSFGAIAFIVSAIIISGISVIVIPKSIDFIITRNLDDAIYKLNSRTSWPSTIVDDISGIHGVKTIVTDKDSTRLVITFDRTMVKPEKFLLYFKQKGLEATMLNLVDHRNRKTIIKQEEELEAI